MQIFLSLSSESKGSDGDTKIWSCWFLGFGGWVAINSSETKASIKFFWISSDPKLYCKSWDSEEYHLNFYLLFWSLNFSVKLSGPRPFLTVGPTWYSNFFFGEEEMESITFFTLSLFVLFIFSISLLICICLTIKFCCKVLHYDCDFYDGDTCLCHSSGLYVLLL